MDRFGRCKANFVAKTPSSGNPHRPNPSQVQGVIEGLSVGANIVRVDSSLIWASVHLLFEHCTSCIWALQFWLKFLHLWLQHRWLCGGSFNKPVIAASKNAILQHPIFYLGLQLRKIVQHHRNICGCSSIFNSPWLQHQSDCTWAVCWSVHKFDLQLFGNWAIHRRFT